MPTVDAKAVVVSTQTAATVDAAIDISDFVIDFIKILLVFAIPKDIFSDAFVFCRIPLSDLLLITVNRDSFGLAARTCQRENGFQTICTA